MAPEPPQKMLTGDEPTFLAVIVAVQVTVSPPPPDLTSAVGFRIRSPTVAAAPRLRSAVGALPEPPEDVSDRRPVSALRRSRKVVTLPSSVETSLWRSLRSS